MTRLATLEARLDGPLLITNLINIRYLTGFEASNAALLVAPGETPKLNTDFRYIEVARATPGVDVVLSKRSLLAELASTLKGTLAFEASALPYAQFEVLGSGGLTLKPTTGIVEALRAIKDETEIAAIRHTATAAERAFEALTADTFVGASEKEVAWRLHQLLHAHGADNPAFESIIAGGLNGSKPHATPSDDIIPARTLVTVDWGAVINGYYSDCTRTLATGELPDELARIYDVCLQAQIAACEGIRPGMTGVEADRVARQVIEDAGYGEHFGHGLGHGVGLEIHEAPRLSTESPDTIEVGQIVTIEPGIYLPGVGGVRIEDLAVVREDGLELLTSFTKELVTVS
jgi:Xaa-Pro aminopeptidase